METKQTKLFISLMIFVFCIGPMDVSGQDRLYNYRIDANALSLGIGHVGPDIRFSVGKKDDRLDMVFGYRTAFTIITTERRQGPGYYYTTLDHVHDLTFGVRLNSRKDKRKSSMFFASLGSYQYNSRQTICTAVASSSSPSLRFCRCTNWIENDFKDRVYQVNIGYEYQRVVWENPSWQIGLSFSIFASNRFRSISNVMSHTSCGFGNTNMPMPDLNNFELWRADNEVPNGIQVSLLPTSYPYSESNYTIIPFMRFGVWVGYNIY